MRKKKKTLRQWSKEELQKIIQDIEIEPQITIEQKLQSRQTWNKIIWFLEWVSEYDQISFIKKLKRTVQKHDIKIDVMRKLKEFALKNKVRIVIPD